MEKDTPTNPHQHLYDLKTVPWAHGAKLTQVPIHAPSDKCPACIWEAGYKAGEAKDSQKEP